MCDQGTAVSEKFNEKCGLESEKVTMHDSRFMIQEGYFWFLSCILHPVSCILIRRYLGNEK